VRHVVVFVTVLMAVVLYLDRYCVSFSERYIKEDLALNESQMAWFISAFFWSYALAQVPAGWLSDRLGSRGVLALYILSWSFFTAMIGLAAGFVMLLTMRLGCGLGQAGAYPTSGALLSRWVPFSRRALASGLVSLGGRVGAVIAPILTAYLMVVFVPRSTPAELDEHSLLNGPVLCSRLLPPVDAERDAKSSSAVRRVFDLLPSDAKRIVVRYGTLMRAGAREIHLEPKESRILASGLNDVLVRGDLFGDDDFARLRNVEREAVDLQKRRQRGEALSESETTRFNRFVLEAMFPAEIGKLYVKGWRPVLWVYGIAGFAVAGIFWFYFRNSPAEHPDCNAAERRLIAGDQPRHAGQPAETVEKFPAREILHSTSLWLSSVSQFGTNFAWAFLVTSLPRYLMEVHHVPILERSWMVSVPALAGIAGMFLGGYLTDRLTRQIGVRWGRALPMALTRFGAAGAYLACLWIKSPWMAAAAFAVAFFFTDLGVSAVWAFMQDVGGKHVGTILGWGNMWGNIGSAFANPLYNVILGSQPATDDWNTLFVVCAATFAVSGLAALGINASVPVAASARVDPRDTASSN